MPQGTYLYSLLRAGRFKIFIQIVQIKSGSGVCFFTEEKIAEAHRKSQNTHKNRGEHLEQAESDG